MIEISRIRCAAVNCYLIKQNGSVVLVDTSYGKHVRSIEKALESRGISPEDLKLIFLTHGHLDHAGGVEHFRQYYGVPVALNPVEDDSCRPFTGYSLSNRVIWALTRATVKRRGPITPDVELEEGMDLSEYGLDARVVSLPGHTAGSMGLLFRDGSLVCGDMFSYLGAQRLTGIAENSPELRWSARKLDQWEVDRVYPGHGHPFVLTEIPALDAHRGWTSTTPGPSMAEQKEKPGIEKAKAAIVGLAAWGKDASLAMAATLAVASKGFAASAKEAMAVDAWPTAMKKLVSYREKKH